MTPRPRLASDEQIVAATGRVIGRLGPNSLTLADVAREMKISPATLVQRFGSKRGLLLAVAAQCSAGVEQCFVQARAAEPSPLEALIASYADTTEWVQTPEALANHLAFLQMDLTDPDFYRYAV